MTADTKTILVLGGYGSAGAVIVEYLLRETRHRVVIAGRSEPRGRACASRLSERFGSDRVDARRADAADRASLRRALDGVSMMVVASSTSAYAREVAEAALEAHVDHVDIQYSAAKFCALAALRARIEEAGLCFISDAGFYPGLPAAMVRLAAARLDEIHSANVAALMRPDWRAMQLSPATYEEMVVDLRKADMRFFEGGEWHKATLGSPGAFKRFRFEPPFEGQTCTPMFLEEMRSLPDQFPSLRETGFFIGGFDPLVGMLVIPACVVAQSLFPRASVRLAGRLFGGSVARTSKPPFCVIMTLLASGRKNGDAERVELTLAHPDGYLATAVAVVACLKQYLDGSIRRPGLYTMGEIVEPERLFSDMASMGLAMR